MIFRKLTAPSLVLLLIAIAFLPLFSGCAGENNRIDYSDEANWAYFGEGEGKSADLFWVCPTVDMGKEGNYNMSMDDEKTKGKFAGAFNMERGIYEDCAVIYAPYYRQLTFPTVNMTEEETKPYLDIAYSDVKAAFEYYIENVNGGRPLILAGFSQGAQLITMLLADYFDRPEYSDLLIAAYCIGWRVTEDYMKENPHLNTAKGEEDTGVIVSFNTEAEGVTDSFVVPAGTKTLSINPLNWRTDSTFADKSLHKGACFTDYDANITSEVAEFTGAYIDSERGTLCVPDVDVEEYSSSMFPKGVFHLFDYQFFFRNLEENVAKRTAKFLENK